jgi:tetratricopeptide (TPR) repeat protein
VLLAKRFHFALLAPYKKAMLNESDLRLFGHLCKFIRAGRMKRTVFAFGILVSGLALSYSTLLSAPVLAATTPEAPSPSRTLTGALLSAQVAEGDNDSAGMIAYYRQALAFDPGSVEFEEKLMISLLQDGRFAEALPFAEKLKAVPEVERVSRVVLAIDAASKKNWTGAETYLKLALQSDLDRLVTGLMTGWVKLGAGDVKAAAQSVASLKGPDWYELFKLMHRAMILDFGGDKVAAAGAYEEVAVSTDASAAPEAWLRTMESYSRFYARDGKSKEALAVLDRAMEIAPERPSLVALKKSITAGEKIEPLLVSSSDGIAEVLLGLGVAIRRDGAEGFSKLYLQLALVAKPTSDVTLIQLASIAEALDQQDAAIANYNAIPATSPFKRGADLQAGLNLADLDKVGEAVTQLTALVSADPTDTRAYLALGGVHSSNKDYKAAAQVYDNAATAIGTPDRNDWNLFYQRGIAHERTKTWPVAEASFKEALKLYPDQPQVLNYLGYSWVDRNENLEEALGMIRKAVELRPDDGYIVDSLGWAYYRLGKFEQAVSELEGAIRLRPEDATINDHLGDSYWRVGRKLEARFQWQHALDAKSEDVNSDIIKVKLGASVPLVAEAISDKKG